MSDEAVLYEVSEGIATLTLNRPERLNAWNGAIGHLYWTHLDAAAADPEVKVIIVTGAGRGFAPGRIWTCCRASVPRVQLKIVAPAVTSTRPTPCPSPSRSSP